MDFDDKGNLIGGILESNLEEVEQYLVLNFPNSSTRKRNFDGLKLLIDELKNSKLIEGVSKLWLDGSFCTNKNDPNDIDIVVLTKPFQEKGNIIFELGMEIRNDFIDHHLDLYFLPDFNVREEEKFEIINNHPEINDIEHFNKLIKSTSFEYQAKYWMGQFGYDRLNNHKAIISIEGCELYD
ncbi:uncharacterized protein DUF6932 [Staphylococcus hominis]|uniref:DUF6932 family protein n=1 Tax=Staphylococcus hominis TaxID=1290 RepID=UPI000778E668|nr:hypothetical protein [Staphylococcus hominis]OAW32726.1 hypothetical protein A7I03_03990 [Staphylococcus hominis]